MNIQTKIIVSIGALVGVMLLFGWIAVNETARMQVFTDQWHARSIEKGAEIFQSTCAGCHGTDAKGGGATGVAPALNNPMLFLDKNPAKVANDQVVALQKQAATIQAAMDTNTKNVASLADLQKQLAAATTDTDKAAIQKQIDGLNSQITAYDPKSPDKLTALQSQITDAQAQVTTLVAQGWDPNTDVRLTQIGWQGTLESYIKGTLISGRPLSSFYWPKPMPNWSQDTGGPLRDDQLDNLVDYIVNFRDMAVKMTPKDVRLQFKIPVSNVPTGPVIGTGFDVQKPGIDYSGGDAAAGAQKYQDMLCAGCHMAAGGAAFPFAPTAGTGTRVVNVRLKDPANAKKTAEQYIAESILYPNAYIVPGAPAGIMPPDFATKLTIQDLKNLIAFLESQK